MQHARGLRKRQFPPTGARRVRVWASGCVPADTPEREQQPALGSRRDPALTTDGTDAPSESDPLPFGLVGRERRLGDGEWKLGET